MNNEELKKIIEAYLFRIVHVNDKYRLYRYLIERENDRLDELNMAPAFFTIVMEALQQSFMIEIFKLFDSNSKTGLVKLLNICMNSNKQFPVERNNIFHEINLDTGETIDTLYDNIKINAKKDIKELELKLKEKEEIINNLRGQRDKYYAHLDKEYFVKKDNISKKFPFLFYDMEELIDFAEEICNTLLIDLCGQSIYYNSTNYNDIKNILDTLYKSNNSN